jgi:hypothetical protein
MRIALMFSVLAFLSPQLAVAGNPSLHLACQAASAGMPLGNGATVYYPNGKLLTNNAGVAGATWYYPNGKLLSNNAGVRGATVYYDNGQLFTNNAGVDGTTWYFANGKLITNDAPAQSIQEMTEMFCTLIENADPAGS